MSAPTPLNVAVVGAGFAHSIDGRENWAVRTHLPAFKSMPELFRVVAVCASHMEAARETADHFGVPHAFADYRALLALPGLDVVTVVVRPRLHHPVAMAALDSGKHVYCEWPLGLNTREAREMTTLAERKGLVTAIGTQGHFWPAAEHMRKLIREGYIGRPLLFAACSFLNDSFTPRPARRHWHFQSAEGGNAAYRAGHLLERIVSTLGEVTDVSADLSTLVRERPKLGEPGVLEGDQVDNMNFLLQMADGVHGTLQVSYTARFGTGQRFEVYGTEGVLMLVREDPGALASRKHNDPAFEAGALFGARIDAAEMLGANRAPETMLQNIRQIPLEDPADLSGSGLPPYGPAYVVRRALKAFGEAIVGGRRFEPDFRTGLGLHEVLEAGEVSVRERRWVKPVRGQT